MQRSYWCICLCTIKEETLDKNFNDKLRKTLECEWSGVNSFPL